MWDLPTKDISMFRNEWYSYFDNRWVLHVFFVRIEHHAPHRCFFFAFFSVFKKLRTTTFDLKSGKHKILVVNITLRFRIILSLAQKVCVIGKLSLIMCRCTFHKKHLPTPFIESVCWHISWKVRPCFFHTKYAAFTPSMTLMLIRIYHPINSPTSERSSLYLWAENPWK